MVNEPSEFQRLVSGCNPDFVPLGVHEDGSRAELKISQNNIFVGRTDSGCKDLLITALAGAMLQRSAEQCCFVIGTANAASGIMAQLVKAPACVHV